MADADDITDLLLARGAGDPHAFDRLFPLVYDHLRRIAHRQLAAEGAWQTLNTTALVHEAYLRLVDQTRVRWVDRGHFFAVASGAMRRVLVDCARRHRAAKRGGLLTHVVLDDVADVATERADALLALDDALNRLAEVDTRLTRVVECRFFGGLTEEETGEALGVTARTVRRDWLKARCWLAEALRE